MILSLFLIWRIGLLIVTYLGTRTFTLVSNGGIGAAGSSRGFDFIKSWAQWDGGYYYSIAQHGYINAKDFAFFPLYPITINVLSHALRGNYLLAGLIISNVSALLAILLFYQLVEKQFNKKVAFYSIATLMTFPTAFFLVAYYSESLFLLLSACLFIALKNKKYKASSVFIGLLSVTRIMGIFSLFSAIYSYLSTKKFNLSKSDWNLPLLIIAPITLISYSVFLFINYGDPFRYLTIESLWKRSLSDPVTTILSYIVPIVTLQKRPINDYFDLALTLFFIIALVLGRKKIPSSWWIFSMLAVIIPASTGTLTSMPRYLLASFGVYVIIGSALIDKKILSLILWAGSLTIQAFLAILFITGRWVA